MTRIDLNRHHGIPARYANRHGLITGATGTGKSVSLMRLAESFSSVGVPVFVADVKGDLSALARSCPARLLDVYGDAGEALRVSLRAMGADLLARALELSDVQSGCLEIAFAFAETRRLPLDTLQDLRQLLGAMIANRESISANFGLISPASIGAIQRAMLRLERQGASRFFGSASFDIGELLEPRRVSILAAERLLHAPRLYSALLLWLLRDLFQRLPEVGDIPAPRLVFFFDEAHTLFDDCPAALLRQIEQTVRLIRSKGVGVYFASQSRDDIPAIVRNQLATRLAHDRQLGVGRARFSTIDASGSPTPQVIVRPDLPACPLGALDAAERAELVTVAAPAAVAVSSDRRTARPWQILAAFAVLLAALVGFLIKSGLEAGLCLTLAALALVTLARLPYPIEAPR